MSSSLASIYPPPSEQSSPKSPLLKPTTSAISLLPTSSARIYSYVHAPLILLYFLTRFKALVAKPFDTMIWDLAPMAVAQCIFCATCLPNAGTWVSSAGASTPGASSPKTTISSTGSTGGSTRRKGKAGAGGLSSASGATSWKSKAMPTLFSLLLTFLLPPLPLTLLALVMGAPLYPTSLIPHTFLLSLHIALLTCLPLFYTHGVSSSAWRDVTAAWLPFDEAGVWGGSVMCMVGGWLGAVPMALDWDRDWQAWPVPVLTGAVLGWAIGNVSMGKIILRGRRIDMSENETAVEEENENKKDR